MPKPTFRLDVAKRFHPSLHKKSLKKRGLWDCYRDACGHGIGCSASRPQGTLQTSLQLCLSLGYCFCWACLTRNEILNFISLNPQTTLNPIPESTQPVKKRAEIRARLLMLSCKGTGRRRKAPMAPEAESKTVSRRPLFKESCSCFCSFEFVVAGWQFSLEFQVDASVYGSNFADQGCVVLPARGSAQRT